MGFFNWAAPLFDRLADRWTPDDIEEIAGPIREALTHCECLLDVGGGTGALAAKLADALDAHVTILDPTPEMVRYAPDRADIDVVIGGAEKMPFEDDAFDALVISDAFHHFRDLEASADEIARVVRSGGVVQIMELDPRRPSIKFIALAERLLREPANFLTPGEMVGFMGSHGIEGSSTPQGDGPSYVFAGRVA